MHQNAATLIERLRALDLTVEDPIEIQGGCQVAIYNGAQRVVVDVYNKSGKCVPRGAQGELLNLVQEHCSAINDGKPLQVGVSDDELANVVPDLQAAGVDEVVAQYVAEAVNAARHELLMSAMFVLGGASERMIYLLTDKLLDAIKDETQHKAAHSAKLVSGQMLERLEHLNDRITKVEKQIPADMKYEWENNIRMLADFYRRTRNAVGHPAVPPNLSSQVVRLAVVVSKGYFLGLSKLCVYLETATLTYPAGGKA